VPFFERSQALAAGVGFGEGGGGGGATPSACKITTLAAPEGVFCEFCSRSTATIETPQNTAIKQLARNSADLLEFQDFIFPSSWNELLLVNKRWWFVRWFAAVYGFCGGLQAGNAICLEYQAGLYFSRRRNFIPRESLIDAVSSGTWF